ncbi:MAG: glycosyltransferase family 4 protein [Candidatus Scalindua sp.]|nr:glycosyltransferase family 4 protein [Candidatus Scalindua sp.]
MNILIVAEGRFPDFVGGSGLVIHHLGKHLADHGHNIHTVTRKAKKSDKFYELIDTINVHRYSAPCIGSFLHKLFPLYSIWGARKLFLKLNKAISFDVIIFNHPFPALGVLSCSMSRNVKKIYILHSSTVGEYLASKNLKNSSINLFDRLIIFIMNQVERFALKKSQKIVTLSKYMQDQVVYIHSEKEDRIEVIPGGVDVNTFQFPANDDEITRLREEFKISKEVLVLFTAKRIYGGMGLENLIDAIEMLVNTGRKNVILFHAGEGPLKSDLEQRIQKKGLNKWIRLLGNIPHENMKSYYQMADLYISTWRQEPFGLVALEALSCGLPVISCPEGGSAEILKGLSKNLLFKDSGISAMAEKIRYFLDHSDRLEDIRNKCRKYVEDNYAWSTTAKKLERLISSVE